MAGQHSPITIVLFVAFIAFSLYRRYRSMVGRQPLVPWRLMLQVSLLSVISLLFLGLSLTRPAAGAAALGGLLAGGALGLVGLRHTRFQRGADRDYYTPNTYLGLVVIALFLARFVYRYAQVSGQIQALPAAGTPPGAGLSSFTSSPLTTALLLLVCGYYLCYAGGLLLWVRRNPPGQAVQERWSQPTRL